MKRGWLAVMLFCLTVATWGQELFDALKFSDLMISGTSRSISMGGAFGALGGDASSIITNPAGMGVYNVREATITANNIYSQHAAGGLTPVKDNNDRVMLSEAAYVHSFHPAGKKYFYASNFGFAYHRLKTFQNANIVNGYSSPSSVVNSATAAAVGVQESDMLEDENPYDNTSVGWLPALAYQSGLMRNNKGTWESVLKGVKTPRYSCEEGGSIDEFDITYAANVANWVYVGASFGIQTLEYSLTFSYMEDFGGGEGFLLKNSSISKGTGWNLKIGAIVRPTDWVRLGFAYHTPTFYSLRYYTQASVESYLLNTENEIVTTSVSTPEGVDSYYFRTAHHYLFSAGFIVKKKALVGIDYELTDYRFMHYGTWKSNEFGLQNIQINNAAKLGHQLKLGFEYRPIEWIALRLGIAAATPTVDAKATKVLPKNSINTSMEQFADKGCFYVSGGVGFRWGNWGIDLAYQFRQQGAKFTAFENDNDINVNNYYHNVLITGMFRF